jgi:hypothetical protein
MTLALANAISNGVLNSVAHDSEDVNVDAPPGSGKTYLLQSCAAIISMHLGKVSLIACNTNEQANELTRRMATRFRTMRIQRLTASGVHSIPTLAGFRNIIIDDTPHVVTTVVTTADKLIESPSAPKVDMLMIDEAYQLKYSSFMMLRRLAPRSLTIGDPGQIDPIVQVSVRHWADDKEGPHLPAPRVILARNEARRFQLPLSRRLPSDSADIVRDAFYPGMTFTGLVTSAMRRLPPRRDDADRSHPRRGARLRLDGRSDAPSPGSDPFRSGAGRSPRPDGPPDPFPSSGGRGRRRSGNDPPTL